MIGATGAQRIDITSKISLCQYTVPFMRTAPARRSGMGAVEIAALVRAIRHEMQATMRAAADRAAQELTGSMASAAAAHAGKRGDPAKSRKRRAGGAKPRG